MNEGTNRTRTVPISGEIRPLQTPQTWITRGPKLKE